MTFTFSFATLSDCWRMSAYGIDCEVMEELLTGSELESIVAEFLTKMKNSSTLGRIHVFAEQFLNWN